MLYYSEHVGGRPHGMKPDR